MKKQFIIFLILVLAGCSYKPTDTTFLRIRGSDTMLNLTKILGQKYMQKNPGISIYVEGGGTSKGVQAITNGYADICTASRTLKPEEIEVLAEKFASIGISFFIAKDALSIYINNDNPVENITLDELKKIYLGKINNWNRLNWINKKIIPVKRNPNSGTQLYFKNHVLDGAEYSDSVVTKNTTKNIIEFIKENKNSIGYGGIGYSEDIKLAKINGIEASEENVRNNSYPISRYLYFYTAVNPHGHIKKFIDWVISREGQRIVKEAGYIPIWEITY